MERRRKGLQYAIRIMSIQTNYTPMWSLSENKAPRLFLHISSNNHSTKQTYSLLLPVAEFPKFSVYVHIGMCILCSIRLVSMWIWIWD